MKLSWTETALEAVGGIETSLNAFSSGAGTRRIRMIRSAARNAARFPRSHRVVPEAGEESIRETFSGPYRIWYRIRDADDRIEILVVFHGARQVPD